MKKIDVACMLLCAFGLTNSVAPALDFAGSLSDFHDKYSNTRPWPLASEDELKQASEVEGQYYVLKERAYAITAPIDLSSSASSVNNLKINSVRTALTLDAAGQSAPLLKVRDFELGAGTLTALGGDSASAQGIYVSGKMTHTGTGTIVAQGGTGGAGIFVGGQGSFAGTMVLERQAAAASAYFSSLSRFTETSVLTPKVDLGKTDALASGLVQGEKGISIANGATLKPVFDNTLTLQEGQSRELLFMDASSGKIAGDFTLATAGTPTLDYSIHKNPGSDKYYVTVTRTDYVDEILDDFEDIEDFFDDETDNAVELFEGIRFGLPGQTGEAAAFFNSLYSRFDNMATEGEMIEASHKAARGLTAHHDTRNAPRAQNKQDSVMLDFSRTLDAVGRHADADDCLARPWRLWANPIYQSTSKREADTPEFTDAKETFGGVSLGVGRDFLGMLTLGVNAHYLRGDVDATDYNASSDTFGISAGLRLHDVLPILRILNPWVEALAGYTHENVKQNRLDYSGNWQRSKPGLDLYYASLTVGNEFGPLLGISVSPLIGLEYAHIRQKSYREQGAGLLSLNHTVDDQDSLRLKVGIEARFEPTKRLDFTAHATGRLEMWDNYASLNSSFNQAPTIRFVTEGEDVARLSGNIGVGIGYRLGKSARIAAGYDLWIAENQLSHQGSLSLSIGF